MRAFLLFPAIVLPAILAAPNQLAAQSTDPPGFGIEGGRFTQLGDTVVISYRLVVPEDEEVLISVTLRKGEDTTFSVKPVSATGAIGAVRGGGDKLILWNYRNDLPPGFQFGTDYWFQFEGVLADRGFSPLWWHYALGGGIIATVAVLAGSSSEDPSSPAPYSLPGPPGIRPPDE